jgi:hypothetical protein
MADAASVTLQPLKRGRIQFPEAVDVVEFTLEIAGRSATSAEELAAQVRRALSEEFAKCDPLLASLYELEIEETEVWEGSRNSRNRGRLKRRRGGSLMDRLKRAGGTALIMLTIASTDYTKITQNLVTVLQKAEQTYSVVIKDVHTFPVNFRSPSP